MSSTPKRIIRLPEVLQRTGYSRSTVYDKIKRGQFPKPVALGPNSSGWVEPEINDHVDGLIAARDGKAA